MSKTVEKIKSFEEFVLERRQKEINFRAFLKHLRHEDELESRIRSLEDELKANPPKRTEYTVIATGKDDKGRLYKDETTISNVYSWTKTQLSLVKAELRGRRNHEKQTKKDEGEKKWNAMKQLAYRRGKVFLKEHPKRKTVPMKLMREIVKEVDPELNDKAITKMAQRLRSHTQRKMPPKRGQWGAVRNL